MAHRISGIAGQRLSGNVLAMYPQRLTRRTCCSPWGTALSALRHLAPPVPFGFTVRAHAGSGAAGRFSVPLTTSYLTPFLLLGGINTMLPSPLISIPRSKAGWLAHPSGGH